MKRKNNPEKDKKRKQLSGVIKYSGLAFQMIVVILVVLYGGMKLDEYLQKEFPLFTVIGAFLGVILSLYFALKDFMKMK
ncbi:AtpZ/AtpI family protein [Marinifilum sp. D714]|uniref:AtpZ/AtpI family protein n=1 Tax=Marinifilum sp. D714 TaxID=2937523 RepID=UPI0027BD0950|nr:AtpZ/AtpI family protein [Marinifilum sp. D714]MDQ2179345.1 AtpZ/AtpI family protein [Marinifilum sp. D714]